VAFIHVNIDDVNVTTTSLILHANFIPHVINHNSLLLNPTELDLTYNLLLSDSLHLTYHHPQRTTKMSHTKSPATNPNITPDPKQDGTTIRRAFLLEAALNLFTIPLITNTRFILSYILLHPSDINPSSILFARLFGGLIVGGLTSALLVGATNTRNGIESRRPTYLLLGLGESCLLPILAIEASKRGSADAALSVGMAVGVIGMLAPPLVWRLYVLGVRPDLLGKYTEEGEGGAKGTKCE
jgi:hypothetical protein